MLTKKQQLILTKFSNGENLFITGPGGCGKSFIINEMISIAKEYKKKYVVTATTGCAAVLLGNNAKTINSWGGIGLANKDADIVVHQVTTNKKKSKPWKTVDILIIDEVSMLSKKIFEILDAIGKEVRNNSKPFGGIQVVFSGDFYQLPPVGDNDPDSKAFCFESHMWIETFKENQICLKKIFRQEGDDVFKKILHQIRKGLITKNSHDVLMSCVNKSNTSDIMPVKLYPRKNVVDAINNQYNNNLTGKHYEYGVRIFETHIDNDNDKNVTRTEIKDSNRRDRFLQTNSLKQIEPLTLKKGSQVMCIVNLDMESDKQICNGSCGTVIDFSTNKNPIVKFHNGRILEMTTYSRKIEYEEKEYEFEMTPLILSWAMTIHKSQGASLDIAEIDIGSDIFECGQTYVALSRVRSLDGLYLTSFDVNKIKIKVKVKNFYENIADH